MYKLQGKAPTFRPSVPIVSPSAPPGRLSLPGGAEGVGWCYPGSERQSLSAQQAAKPQMAPRLFDRNLDKLEMTTPATRAFGRHFTLFQRLCPQGERAD